jgi:hypothetical protein
VDSSLSQLLIAVGGAAVVHHVAPKAGAAFGRAVRPDVRTLALVIILRQYANTVSNSNSFANGFCIPIFAKKSTKLLSNGLANELCIFVNLAKFWDGLAYMQARDRLGIPSHALLPRALFPPAPPGFLFWILASQFCQTVGDNFFFLLPILI